MKAALVIPLYNHGRSVREVVLKSLPYLPCVIVVDDGSSDCGADTLRDLPVQVERIPHSGKGAAILCGARKAFSLGATHIVTLDADGQHCPCDIPLFLAGIERDPLAFYVGNRQFSGDFVPFSSRLGRAFSSFWMLVQTGVTVSDMQSGFRAYPLKPLLGLVCRERGYAFEVEVLVRAAWAGYTVRSLAIRVLYPENRISHFHPLRDNWAMTRLNTLLTIRAMLPIPWDRPGDALSLRHPYAALKVLRTKATPLRLAASVSTSLCISTLPFFGLQTIFLLLAIGRLRIHRVAALLVVPLTWPPFVPGFAVLLGYRIRKGEWLTTFSVTTLGLEAYDRLIDWFVGSLCLAPLLAALAFALVWLVARSIRFGS